MGGRDTQQWIEPEPQTGKPDATARLVREAELDQDAHTISKECP